MKNEMKSSKPGKRTSAPEITHISRQGIWLLFEDREHYLSYKDFPWFKQGTVEQIHQVEHHGRGHMHWPALDVDLDLARIQNPEKYPLIARY